MRRTLPPEAFAIDLVVATLSFASDLTGALKLRCAVGVDLLFGLLLQSLDQHRAILMLFDRSATAFGHCRADLAIAKCWLHA